MRAPADECSVNTLVVLRRRSGRAALHLSYPLPPLSHSVPFAFMFNYCPRSLAQRRPFITSMANCRAILIASFGIDFPGSQLTGARASASGISNLSYIFIIRANERTNERGAYKYGRGDFQSGCSEILVSSRSRARGEPRLYRLPRDLHTAASIDCESGRFTCKSCFSAYSELSSPSLFLERLPRESGEMKVVKLAVYIYRASLL